jgi:hypothetical protein
MIAPGPEFAMRHSERSRALRKDGTVARAPGRQARGKPG